MHLNLRTWLVPGPEHVHDSPLAVDLRQLQEVVPQCAYRPGRREVVPDIENGNLDVLVDVGHPVRQPAHDFDQHGVSVVAQDLPAGLGQSTHSHLVELDMHSSAHAVGISVQGTFHVVQRSADDAVLLGPRLSTVLGRGRASRYRCQQNRSCQGTHGLLNDLKHDSSPYACS